MSVRLNKVMTTLNIGLDTVYDFLRGKPELGTIENLTINSKITDEQYEALKKKYQGDATIKKNASSVFSKISKRKNKKVKEDNTSGLKILGKIDLDSLNLKTRPVKKTRAELKQKVDDNTTYETPINVTMGEFDFAKHQMTYWSEGKKFTLLDKHISANLNNLRADFENIKVAIQLDYQNSRFKFVESSFLQSLIQTYQDKERERKRKEKKEKEAKKLDQKRSNVINSILQKAKKPEREAVEIKDSISLSSIRFTGSLATITFNGKTHRSYVTKNEKRLLLSLNRTLSIPIIINTAGGTFRFGIGISELVEKKDLQKQPVPLKPFPQQKVRLGIENVEFHEGYYLIWIIRQGKKDMSIAPLRITDTNSLPCLRLIQKYFAERFPKGIDVIYDSQHIVGLSQAYTLGSYIKVLNNNIDEHGEWWEEVQNDRRPTLAACRKTSSTLVRKEMSLRNCYLDYLAGMPNQKTALKVYEVRQNQQEDVFIFTVIIGIGSYAVIFENVSFTSTATWVFIVREENYEECINRIFDYFTNYELHNKRQSLIKSLNPPQKFKAEDYYKIMHDEPRGWIKRLNDILDREIPLNRIQFNQGLHIAKEADSRIGSPEIIKVQHLHNELMRRLYCQLCQQFGEENVGTENHIGTKKIDVVARTGGGYNIYEIKTDIEPRGCIREAMGQILDYAFFECEDIIHKMVIVGATPETKEVKTYLTKFREKNALEIYYIAV